MGKGSGLLWYVMLHLCLDVFSGHVQCPVRSLAPFFLPVSLAGVSPNPLEKLRPHLRNAVHPLLPSTPWFLLTHAFHALWLKKIAQPSKTFFEGGTLLIYLWIHLAWCPAHRSDSLSVYWLASFQFTRLYGLEIHSPALLWLSRP